MIKIFIKKRNIKMKLFLLILLISILPYPTKAFSPIRLLLVDEFDNPISNVIGYFNFTLYPSIKEKKINFVLNEKGEVYIPSKYVWMSWVVRRAYDLLDIFLRCGWSDPSSTIKIIIPHKNVKMEMVRMAILYIKDIKMNQCSAEPPMKFASTSYIGIKGQYWSIENSFSDKEDIIKLYIQKSCDKTNSNIKLKMRTIYPNSIDCNKSLK